MITNEKGNAGGFIGGYVQNRRNKANVKSRSIISIDIDEVPQGVNVWENIEGLQISRLLCIQHTSIQKMIHGTGSSYLCITTLSRNTIKRSHDI